MTEGLYKLMIIIGGILLVIASLKIGGLIGLIFLLLLALLLLTITGRWEYG